MDKKVLYTILLAFKFSRNTNDSDFCRPNMEVFICESKKCTIQCEPMAPIVITFASYGRTDRQTCSHRRVRSTTCSAETAMQKISEKCNNKTSCVVEASNRIFGDPCRNTYKYVNLTYRCSEIKQVPPLKPATDLEITVIIVVTVTVLTVVVCSHLIILFWRMKTKKKDSENEVYSVMDGNDSQPRNNTNNLSFDGVYEQNRNDFIDHRYIDLSHSPEENPYYSIPDIRDSMDYQNSNWSCHSQEKTRYIVPNRHHYTDHKYSDLSPPSQENSHYTLLN